MFLPLKYNLVLNKLIAFKPRKIIDLERWDACITQAYNGMPYGYSWYLDAICKGRWNALVLNNYEAVFPLPFNRKYFGLAQIYHPFYAQQLGVFSQIPLDKKLVEAFQKAIPWYYWRVRTQLNEQHVKVDIPKFTFQEKTNYVLSIPSSSEELWKGYSTNTKRNVKKGQKTLQAIARISTELFLDFYKKNPIEQSKKRNRQYVEMLQDLLFILEKRQKGKAIGVRDHKGDLLAACFIINSHQRLIYLTARTNEEGRKKGATHFLIHSIVEQYLNRGYSFDFEGSMIPSLARFFASFGAKKRQYNLMTRR